MMTNPVKRQTPSLSTRKEPNPPAKHILSTKELLHKAQFVSELTDPWVEVPIHVQSLLNQAIQARKRWSAWFHRMSNSDTPADVIESNKAHEYFIEVLEKAFNILKPRLEAQETKGTPVQDETSSSSSLEGSNRFVTLEVEEIDQDVLDALPLFQLLEKYQLQVCHVEDSLAVAPMEYQYLIQPELLPNNDH
ncbi:hypothetical protein BKA65DRAFT_546679 [Rhexocercosporidium sp. MPI-PUGE-AT-0058]|nr:hypothetical protein BKA65DRAFT_546679 [Rhexocercosporidium sp. MPI-PUGE-AT-0058]